MTFDEILFYGSFIGAGVGGAVRYGVNGTKESRWNYFKLVLYSALMGFGMVCALEFFVPSIKGRTCLGAGILIGLCGPDQLIFFNLIVEGGKEIIVASVRRFVRGIKRKGNDDE